MNVSRDELVEVMERYFEALPTSDPTGLPLADTVKFTENGQLLPLGTGLWATADGLAGPRALHVADPTIGQVASWGLVSEGGAPTILAVRLRLGPEGITEIETLACRPHRHDDGGLLSVEGMIGQRAIFAQEVDAGLRSSRDELTEMPNRYLDAIVACDSRHLPVRDDCVRIENGVQTVLNPTGAGIRPDRRDQPYWGMRVAQQIDTGIFRDIEAARDRRCLAVDEERGLVCIRFAFDHPGPVTSAAHESRYLEPNSMAAFEVFKVVGGEIRQIEAVLDVFPYGMPLGWGEEL
jgi:hypothetical protein